jgi:PAS domain S-box-containing protein
MSDAVRLLAVTDDDDARERLVAFFERDGIPVDPAAAGSAEAAHRRLDGGEFDCVVSEYQLAETDGLALFEGVRREYPSLPFVVFTDDESALADALERGVTGAVPKGGDERYRLLAHRVETAVDRARTERRRRRYETLVETAGDAMYVLDADGHIIAANDELADLLGADREAALGTHVQQFLAAGDFERGTDVVVETMGDPDRDAATYEVTVTPLDGEPFPAEASVAPIRDERGDHRATAGVVRDIDERKERERRLGALHDTTRLLVDADDVEAAVGIAVDAAETVLELDAAGFYAPEGWAASGDGDGEGDAETLAPVAVTDGARELFGDPPLIERGEGLVWRVYESGDPIFAGDIREYPSVYDPETPVRSELLVPAGDHGVFMAASTEPDDFDRTDRDLARVLVANLARAVDIVIRERRLRERERQLRRENERLEEFASIVSHDLQNPLMVAQGRASAAIEDCDSEHLPYVERSLDRMERIIDDTLTLARAGMTVGETERVAVDRLAEKCWAAIDTAEAELRVGDVPPVDADPDRLRHVFENLYRNAVEHAGPNATVRVGPLAAGFFVEDTGSGIPPDRREDVFEPGHTTAEDGTGFGLAIVADIVEAHGWTIDATESDDGGARFEVTGIERPD